MNTLQRLLLVLAPFLAAQLTGCSPATTATTAGETVTAIADTRSFGTQLDDEIIELNAANAIYQDPKLNQQSHFNITSYNFIVLITGEATTKEIKARIQQIVQSIPKVRRVHNMMTIAAPSSILTRTSDLALTTQIKAAMISQGKNFGHRIKVVTENGTTYLMGIVTRKQGDHATSITQQISGVQKIVKLFEYTD